MTRLEVLSEVWDPIFCEDMSISLSYDWVDPYEERLKIPLTSSVEIWFAAASVEVIPPLQHSRMKIEVFSTHRISTSSSDASHSVGSTCGIVNIIASQTMEPMRYTVTISEPADGEIRCSRWRRRFKQMAARTERKTDVKYGPLI